MSELVDVFRELAKDALKTYIRSELLADMANMTNSVETMVQDLSDRGFSREEQIEQISECRDILSEPFNEIIRKLEEDE